MGHIIANIFFKKRLGCEYAVKSNFTDFSTNFKEFNKYQVQIDIAFAGSK